MNTGMRYTFGRSKFPTDKLIAFCNLDQTSGPVIEEVNGYDGIAYGGIVRGVPGKIGNAFSYNGVDSYVSFPQLNDKIGTNSFTASCWFKTTQTDVFRLIQNRGGGAFGSVPGFQISQYLGEWNNTFIDDGNGNAIRFPLSYLENDIEWHLINLRFDNSQGKGELIIDNERSLIQQNLNLIGANLNSLDFELGRSTTDGVVVANQYYDGDQDLFSLHLKWLTDNEISRMWNNQKGLKFR